ncbi:MAG: ABC transporter permease subunit [Proteobacteria bacterium]|nr:ABC transporter permease subunit [Pseudomonadota bacterium]MBU4469774.1 ABC transporter permease subunit [Pseudomonadota bacterium]MCG2753009.1 ABC transporter permease subunit [Desulfobacteraceae bacterium]
MLYRRIYQFLIVYFLGLGGLFAVKFILGLSDYVIPSPVEVWLTTKNYFVNFFFNVLDTLSVAIVGHMMSICLATTVAIIGRKANWLGSFIKIGAYNIQAYPIVAVAPIIFMLFGDGLSSRLLITSMICYFPLLLSFIGIFSEPITDIEHFYTSTGQMTWWLPLKIRIFENTSKLITVISGTATVAMVGTIVAEFIAGDSGIGHSILIARYQSDLSKILVALFLIGICISIYLFILECMGLLIQRKLDIPQGGSE